MVNDPDDREIAGIGLTSRCLTGSGAADADHPISGDGADGIDGNLLGTAIKHHLKVLVLEVRDAVG